MIEEEKLIENIVEELFDKFGIKVIFAYNMCLEKFEESEKCLTDLLWKMVSETESSKNLKDISLEEVRAKILKCIKETLDAWDEAEENRNLDYD